MKKIIIPIMLLATLSCSYVKTNENNENIKPLKLSHLILNKHFDQNSKLPDILTKNLLHQGKKTYTVGVLKANMLSNNDYEFNDIVNVRSAFYSYSTIKKKDSELINLYDENRVIFNNDFNIQDKAIINMRINTSKNLADLLIFKNINANGIVYINIKNSGITPRYLKIPIIELSKDKNINFKLYNPVKVNGAEYILEKSYTQTSQIISLTPKFTSTTIANDYREKEINNPYEPKIENINNKNQIYLREKITLFLSDDIIGNSHIIDIVSK